MKKILIITMVAVVLLIAVAGCTDPEGEKVMEDKKITISAGGRLFEVTLYDNHTAKEFVSMFPVELNMKDLNSNEKYAYVDKALPTDARRVGKINKGEIMLYGDDCIVIFYDSFVSGYSYTPIGRIVDTRDLESTLGKDAVNVVWKISE